MTTPQRPRDLHSTGMAAKVALAKILSEKSYSLMDMNAAALTKVRDHRMSVDAVRKLRKDLFDKGSNPAIDEDTVATIVHDMVELAFSQRHGQEPLKDDAETGERHVDTSANFSTDKKVSDSPSTHASTQASFSLSKEDISSLVLAVDGLKVILSEEREAARDSELRLQRKIKELSDQVRELHENISTVRLEAVVREQSLSKQLNDIKARLNSTTAQTSKSKLRDGHGAPSTCKEKEKQCTNVNVVEQKSEVEDQGVARNGSERWANDDDTLVQSSSDVIQLSDEGRTKYDYVTILRRGVDMHQENKLTKSSTTVPTNSSRQANDGREREVRRFPQLESDDETWQLVAKSKPTGKKAVLYIGNISSECATEENIVEYIERRAKSIGLVMPVVHNFRIFPGKEEFSGARITIDAASASALSDNTFWPKPLYVRPWNFEKRVTALDPPAAEPQLATCDASIQSRSSQ